MGPAVKCLLVLAAAAIPAAAPARDAGTVAAVEAPVWLVRGETTSPLAPGAVLREGDRLRTGPAARAVLSLAEGSVVKLGENAEFTLRGLGPAGAGTGKGADRPLVRGFLDVLKGAFRFTTTLVSRRYRRDLEVRVGTITAGIRGTDIWGRADPERDFVLLIEGRIDVRRDRDPPVDLTEPLTAFAVPRGRPAEPVAPVPPADVAALARETDPRPGQGVMEAGGRWRANLRSFRTRAAAGADARALRRRGIPAVVEPAEVRGETWFRVGVPGLASAADARAFTARMGGGWISIQRGQTPLN